MRQVLSHYQAVIPNNTIPFDLSRAIGIDGLIDLLTQESIDDDDVAVLNDQIRFIVPVMVMFEEDLLGDIGTIRLTREHHLFPTMEEHQLGAVIRYLGKEFVVFYDSELRLNIGCNGSLYCFDDSKTYSDDQEIIYSICCEHVDITQFV